MSRLLVGPFNRVEGDLEVQLDVQGGRVASAQVNATMYRGFEQILQGKVPHDALVYVPRICGICSVSQSVAAARALAHLGGIEMPANGQHATNVILATENLADHLTHFYLFFMPDFTRPVYAPHAWHAEAVRRFAPNHGEQVRAATAARQRWLTLMGTLGGKWPHTQSIEPGGSTRPIDAAERVRLLSRVREFRAFLERQLFAAPLEAMAELQTEDALWDWHAQDPQGGDLRFFLTLVRDLQLGALGPGPLLHDPALRRLPDDAGPIGQHRRRRAARGAHRFVARPRPAGGAEAARRGVSQATARSMSGSSRRSMMWSTSPYVTAWAPRTM
jgi:hypothetical protein